MAAYWSVNNLKELIILRIVSDNDMTLYEIPMSDKQYEIFRDRGDNAYRLLKNVKEDNLRDARRVADEVIAKMEGK